MARKPVHIDLSIAFEVVRILRAESTRGYRRVRGKSPEEIANWEAQADALCRLADDVEALTK